MEGLERKQPFSLPPAAAGVTSGNPNRIFLGTRGAAVPPALLWRNATRISSLWGPGDGLKPGFASACQFSLAQPPRGRQPGPAARHPPLAAARSAQLRTSPRSSTPHRDATGRAAYPGLALAGLTDGCLLPPALSQVSGMSSGNEALVRSLKLKCVPLTKEIILGGTEEKVICI